MNPKKPYCPGCGALKTVENTSQKWNANGNLLFHYLCKTCDSQRAIRTRLKSFTQHELIRLLNKHQHNIETVQEELARRKNVKQNKI